MQIDNEMDCIKKKQQWITFTFTSKNSAPNDSTCSLTAARVSKALTIAPIFLAVPTADKPATPPPMTRIFAGGIFPAAVIWPILSNEIRIIKKK